MFYYLKGKVTIKEEDFLVIEVGGVGYKVLISPESKNDFQGEVKIFCFMQKTDKEDRLYGFKKKENFELFSTLLKISGIGPQKALSIASCTSLEEIKRGIEENDEEVMKKIFSIGEKRGQQVIFELSRKIAKKKTKKKDEVFEALQGLGFKKEEIEEVLEKVCPRKKKEKRIEEALKILGK